MKNSDSDYVAEDESKDKSTQAQPMKIKKRSISKKQQASDLIKSKW